MTCRGHSKDRSRSQKLWRSVLLRILGPSMRQSLPLARIVFCRSKRRLAPIGMHPSTAFRGVTAASEKVVQELPRFRPDQTRRASSLIGTEPALLARSRCWLGLLSRARGDADSFDPGRSRRLGQPPVFSLPSASSSYGPGRFSILHRPKLRATSAWSCPTVMSTKKPSVASTWPGASISG